MSLTKKDISKLLSSELHITMNEANEIIDKFILSIIKCSKKSSIKLTNFGTFTHKITKRRVGRNPKTLESYIIPSTNKLVLVPSKKVKESLN
tara:strand:- start:4912 stop:5187 length:276 start_codon:yes stop_codon:yes gene_type:complete